VPTVVGFPAHKTINPYTAAVAKVAVEYRNSTSSHKKIADFAAGLLPDDLVTRIESVAALAAARQAGAYTCPLFSSTCAILVTEPTNPTTH